MSLILDALRKADLERERESVPGLHTQPVPPLSLERAPPVRGTRWRWIALGTIALLAGALGWVLLGRSSPPATAPALASAPEPVVSPAPAPVPPPNAVAPNALAIEAPKEVAPPAAWPAERKPASKAPGRAGGVADTAPGAGATAVPAAYAREQLPDNIRGALPPLSVGGSIYSSTPANRSLILDGRLYREGELVANDLVLEEIGQKTAVLQFRGYRFEIRY